MLHPQWDGPLHHLHRLEEGGCCFPFPFRASGTHPVPAYPRPTEGTCGTQRSDVAKSMWHSLYTTPPLQQARPKPPALQGSFFGYLP